MKLGMRTEIQMHKYSIQRTYIERSLSSIYILQCKTMMDVVLRQFFQYIQYFPITHPLDIARYIQNYVYCLHAHFHYGNSIVLMPYHYYQGYQLIIFYSLISILSYRANELEQTQSDKVNKLAKSSSNNNKNNFRTTHTYWFKLLLKIAKIVMVYE